MSTETDKPLKIKTMKLENQVVPIEQAKRLKELGVIQKSLFYYNYQKDFGFGGVQESEQYLNIGLGKPQLLTEALYSAYGVAELGVMFGIGTRATDWLVNTMCRPSKTVMWNPYFLAKCLIEALETGITTAAEVNERLNQN